MQSKKLKNTNKYLKPAASNLPTIYSSLETLHAFEMISLDKSTLHKSTGCPVKLFTLSNLLLCQLLLVQFAKNGTFYKNSGNLLHDRHTNFENRFRNA